MGVLIDMTTKTEITMQLNRTHVLKNSGILFSIVSVF